MTLRAAFTIVFCVFFSTTFAVQAETSRSTGQRQESTSSPVQVALTKPVYEEVTKLILTYYPNAKINEKGGKLHFEFKAAPHISTSTNLPVIGPGGRRDSRRC